MASGRTRDGPALWPSARGGGVPRTGCAGWVTSNLGDDLPPPAAEQQPRQVQRMASIHCSPVPRRRPRWPHSRRPPPPRRPGRPRPAARGGSSAIPAGESYRRPRPSVRAGVHFLQRRTLTDVDEITSKHEAPGYHSHASPALHCWLGTEAVHNCPNRSLQLSVEKSGVHTP